MQLRSSCTVHERNRHDFLFRFQQLREQEEQSPAGSSLLYKVFIPVVSPGETAFIVQLQQLPRALDETGTTAI